MTKDRLKNRVKEPLNTFDAEKFIQKIGRKLGTSKWFTISQEMIWGSGGGKKPNLHSLRIKSYLRFYYLRQIPVAM